jgi:hypothetical protein
MDKQNGIYYLRRQVPMDSRGDLKGETESEIIKTHDHALET